MPGHCSGCLTLQEHQKGPALQWDPPASAGALTPPPTSPRTVLAPVPRLSLQIAHGRVFHRAFPLFLLFLLDMRAAKTELRFTQRFLAVCCTLALVPRAILHPHEVHGLTNAWPRNGLPENLMMGACRDLVLIVAITPGLDLLQSGLASRASLPCQSLSLPQDTQHTDRHSPTSTLTLVVQTQESS